MHESIKELPHFYPNEYRVFLKTEGGIKSFRDFCKDSLIWSLKYTDSGWDGDMRGGDVFYKFSISLNVLKERVLKLFKLFTEETPCQFYKFDESTTIVRLKVNSFFRKHWMLTDFFTVLLRMAVKQEVAETKGGLVDQLTIFKWGSYDYDSRFMRNAILYFEEFQEVMFNPENEGYLSTYWGLKDLSGGVRHGYIRNALNEKGACIKPDQICPVTESLRAFYDK